MSSADPASTTDDVGRSKLTRFLAAVGAALLVSSLAVFIAPAPKAEAAAPGPKDTIAVLFSYTWNAIARECTNTLGPAGYGYVQTSPPQEHVLGQQWWTYYQPVSYKLESRMGTEAQFKQMIDTCNAAGVKVIVDAVINHMSGKTDGGTGWAGSSFQHYNYPGLYSSSDFHSCRRDIASYQNRQEVQECNLVNLSDLNTGSASVQEKIAGYLNKLVDLGAAGFRFDAVKHISKEDMWGIWNRVKNKESLYVVQEVIRANEPIQPEEYIGIGDIHEFAYARKLKEAFGGSSINWLIAGPGIGSTWQGFLQNKDAAVFVDNHDTERNLETLSYRDGASYDLAQIFTLAWNYGSPSIHSGYTFGHPSNETEKDKGPITDGSGKVIDPVQGQGNWTFKHAQNNIKNMVGFRNTTYGTEITNKWDNGGNAIAFGRGAKGYVVINNGSGEVNRTFTTSLPDGEYYNVSEATKSGSTWSGATVVVSGGKFTATVGGKKSLAIHVDAKKGGVIVDPDPVDTQAPTVPTNVKATANGTSITVSWTASTDDKKIAGYTIERTNGTTVKQFESTGTGTSFTDTGLAANTEYSYTVKAFDGTNRSGASSKATAKTGAAPVGGSSTIYYSTEKNWTKYYAHYQVGSGAWTTVPGKELTAACTGWVKGEIDLGTATTWKAAFNNGSGTWDNNGSRDYSLAAGVQAVKGGQISTVDPCPAPEPVTPSVPTGLKATVTDTTITASWTASTGATKYTLVYAGPTGTKTVTTSSTSATITGLTAKTLYGLKVRAANDAGKSSDYSARVNATTTASATLEAPTGLKATVTGTSIAVTWNKTTGASKYVLVYAAPTGTKTLDVTTNSANLTGLAPSTLYGLKVRAANAQGASSPYSVRVNATTGTNGGTTTTPAVPTGLKATVTGTTIAATWNASPGATKYTLTYAAPNGTKTVDVTTTSANLTGLTANTLYGLKVRATNSAGSSADSARVNATTAGTTPQPTTTPTPTPQPTTPPGPGTAVGTDHSVALYKTNPNGQVGKSKTITVDGNPSDWTADMLIAQGVANDDPRIFRGSHEGPVYDPYSLYGAWDAENLYLMWQFTNVTDVVDPAQGYPISDNGKPANGDIPQALAFDVNSRGGDGLEDGEEKGIWGMRYKFDNKEVDHLALFSSKPGVGQPALFSLNANDAFDYEPANVAAFKASGISFAYGDGFFPTTLMGIKKNGYEGYTPADLTDASKFTDLLKAGHSTKQDTIYEIKIPLAKLGTTKAQLEANGLGVMLITTFGQSAIGSLPYDPATLDNATKPYSADESTSAEKEDWDGFTAKFARVGK
ncbi:fibronectin type III domain-containing protein [Agromyces atrinae]|uniref:Alpha-amylase n=1 Tax=Agromyces atrinae TaxID=592376 RepID=A0A4Q2M4N3_9MICO|nr:fibronectin type III domain-containing protein [Agromyces atrinae]NYD67366.1 glycosidase [Agromyces atrinae]RXZ86808.1 hypothetical protein ESP50_07005 [Agromyces atrinae]